MTFRIVCSAIVAAYLLVMVPFVPYMQSRPMAVKLGNFPEAEALKMVCGDQRVFVADYALLKVLFYYGTLAEKMQKKIKLAPEYFNMFKMLETAVKLDPYNADAYYFTEAAFTWEVGRVRDVNRMLIYGMRYRTWDYNLPFYVGFNSAYFLKDYATAAEYMKKAAQISGEPLYTNLAARFFHEAGKTDLGIIFLSSMEKGARDQKIRQVYATRKEALLAVKELERAIARFEQTQHRRPANLDELVAAGIIRAIPADPYGGTFYLQPDGKVMSTSKFAFGRQSR